MAKRTPSISPRWRVTATAGALSLAFACASNRQASPGDQMGGAASAGGPSGTAGYGNAGVAGASDFAPTQPSVYVNKVKSVLLGLPATDDELARVSADPGQFKALVGEWLQQPEYQDKMLRFFELAFQQTQVSETDFSDQAYPRRLVINPAVSLPLIRNAEESFARTVLALDDESRPLSDAITTHRYMLTTALKEVYAFLDVWQVDDDGKVQDAFKKANPKLSIYAEAAAGPIPLSESLDPASPNYLHFYDPDVTAAGASPAGCASDPIVYPANASTLHLLLYGTLVPWKTADGVACSQFGGTPAAPQLTSADFNDWTMVTVRAPKAGEAVTPFYDLASLRQAKELVLNLPRVGFFTTPAFFANWQTNISNQMRVTLNQALIVALGAQVDGVDQTPTGDPPPGLDADHAGSADCVFCHRTLDPLRSIFSANYSWNYHAQNDPVWSAQKGLFAFQGVSRAVDNLDDFAEALANHPLFAAAWVQKLCYYVNSAPCSTSDPEFQRVVAAFRASGYSFSALLQEVLSSPLVTGTAATRTRSDTGEVIAVSRRDHLCAALDHRLGFTDVCGLRALTRKQQSGLIASIAAGLPSDGYGRGSTAPVLPNQPTLFYRAGLENICSAVAAQVIDVATAKQVPGVKQWSSKDPTSAIAEFVSLMLGFSASDARAPAATNLLQAHFDAAKSAGQSASVALKSTFITACLAPSFSAVGL